MLVQCWFIPAMVEESGEWLPSTTEEDSGGIGTERLQETSNWKFHIKSGIY